MLCKIKLFPKNVPLDNSYANAVNFTNISKETFFAKYDSNYNLIDYQEPIVFPFNDGLNCKITIGIDNINYMNVNDILNTNYLHMRTYDENTNVVIKDYFYFIISSKVLNRNAIELTLECDVLTTYFDCFDNNKKVFIERIHQNRFSGVVDGDNLRLIDNNFSCDELSGKFNANIANEIKTNHLLSIHDDVGLNTQLNNLWCYIFLSEIWEDVVEDSSIDYPKGFSYIDNNGKEFGTPYYCVCCPINFQLQENIPFKTWLYHLASNPICVSIIFSYAPPILNLSESECHLVDGWINPCLTFANDITRNGTTILNFRYNKERSISDNNKLSMSCLYVENWQGVFQYANIIEKIIYQKPSTPIEKTISLNDEPCLNTLPFKKIVLTTPFGEKQMYDLNKLSIGNTNINLNLKEVISPSGTKSICDLENENILDNYYKDKIKTKDGLVSASSYSLPPINDKLVDYLENNKNYKTSVYANAMFGGVKALSNTNLGNAKTKTLGIGLNVAETFLNNTLSIDKLESTPNTIGNIGNDIGYDFITSYKKPYIIIYDLDYFSKQQVYDFYFKYGKIYNKLANLDLDSLCKRCNFTYIKTIETTFRDKIKSDYLLNNTICEKIKNIFNKGVTFWNIEYVYDGVTYQFPIGDYSNQNWERRIFE